MGVVGGGRMVSGICVVVDDVVVVVVACWEEAPYFELKAWVILARLGSGIFLDAAVACLVACLVTAAAAAVFFVVVADTVFCDDLPVC